MCGVIGYWPTRPESEAREAFGRLFRESTVRGLHCFGLYQSGHVVYHTFNWTEFKFDPSVPAVAHARYSTSGDWQDLRNAQPIVTEHFALAMNGVISMGTKAEYEAEFDVQCEADNDAEVFLRRLERGEDPGHVLSTLRGSFAGVWLSSIHVNRVEEVALHAGRNPRRPLWKHTQYGATWYASTRDIFIRALFGEPTEVGVGVEQAR